LGVIPVRPEFPLAAVRLAFFVPQFFIAACHPECHGKPSYFSELIFRATRRIILSSNDVSVNNFFGSSFR
jgi:hypothetical protein